MAEREDLGKHAETELIKTIDTSIKRISPSAELDSQNLYDQFLFCGYLNITAPEEESPMIHCLTLGSLGDYRTGSSIKPGNIRLNLNKLMTLIPDAIGLTVGIVNDIPILKVCAALDLWGRIRETAKIDITKEQAFVIVALWKNCNSFHKISIDYGYTVTIHLLERYGENAITHKKYDYILASLEHIGCIELEDGYIWLREWISKKYLDCVW